MRLAILSLLVCCGVSAAAPVPPPPPPDPLGRAFMGVLFDDTRLNLNVYVQKPIRGLAAEKAGVQAGDRLVRVGTLKDFTQQQVIAHVATYRPGAVVEVEVERMDWSDGNRRLVTKVLLVRLTERPAQLPEDDDDDDRPDD